MQNAQIVLAYKKWMWNNSTCWMNFTFLKNGDDFKEVRSFASIFSLYITISARQWWNFVGAMRRTTLNLWWCWFLVRAFRPLFHSFSRAAASLSCFFHFSFSFRRATEVGYSWLPSGIMFPVLETATYTFIRNDSFLPSLKCLTLERIVDPHLKHTVWKWSIP